MSARILAVGEVLWDVLPDGKQLGGAPANFAFHARGLGANASIVTRVGDDPLGREVLDRFAALGLPVETVQIDPDRPTGRAVATPDAQGQAHFTILENVAWDRIAADDLALTAARLADAVCFGSLAQRDEPSRSSIRTLIDAAPATALRVFDVNLRPPFIDRDIVARSLDRADVLKINDQELPEVAAMFAFHGGTRAMIEALADRFGLSVVALTRGSQGSLIWRAGEWADHPGHRVEVVDTIGAGDSFTAALTVGLLAGRSLESINAHANAVAAFVCSRAGGTPILPEDLRHPTQDDR